MPVPTSINDLSQTAGSNSPSGSDSPTVTDDHLRAGYSFIAVLRDDKADSADVVALTGAQTIAGVKTFSSTPVVPDDSFTFSKLQNIATARVLGRTTASSGDIEELTATQVAALLPAASTSASGLVELATSAEAIAGTDTTRALTPSTLKSAQIVLGTSVASTSGTSIDFTSLPSWTRRISVTFNSVSTNGSSPVIIRIGSGSVVTTGYSSTGGVIQGTSVGSLNDTTGFVLEESGGGALTRSGCATLTLNSGNTWVISGNLFEGGGAGARVTMFGGILSLGGALDRVRITTVGGTDTFDSGAINISWE